MAKRKKGNKKQVKELKMLFLEKWYERRNKSIN